MDSRQSGLWSSHLSDASVRQRSLPPPPPVNNRDQHPPPVSNRDQQP